MIFGEKGSEEKWSDQYTLQNTLQYTLQNEIGGGAFTDYFKFLPRDAYFA